MMRGHPRTSRQIFFLEPPLLFATCNAYHEAVFCGVANKKWLQMTFMTIRQPVSFEFSNRIQFLSLKTRTWGQFGPSFGCPILRKLSASGGFASEALIPWPWGFAPRCRFGLFPDHRYQLALRDRHGQGPSTFYPSLPLCPSEILNRILTARFVEQLAVFAQYYLISSHIISSELNWTELDQGLNGQGPQQGRISCRTGLGGSSPHPQTLLKPLPMRPSPFNKSVTTHGMRPSWLRHMTVKCYPSL